MVQGGYFNLAAISKNSILTILKATILKVSKAAGLDSKGWNKNFRQNR